MLRNATDLANTPTVSLAARHNSISNISVEGLLHGGVLVISVLTLWEPF